MELLLWVLIMPATSMVDQRSFNEPLIGITEFFPGEAPTRAMSLAALGKAQSDIQNRAPWPKGALASRTMHRSQIIVAFAAALPVQLQPRHPFSQLPRGVADCAAREPLPEHLPEL